MSISCPKCGQFIGKRIHKCSDTSWNKGKNSRIIFFCKVCKKPILDYKRANRKVCSKECFSINASNFMKGKILYKIHPRGMLNKVPWNKGKKMDKPVWNKGLTAKKDNRILSGKEHYKWNGGISLKYGKEWKNIRKQIWKRDNFTCQKCGKKNVELIAHHIIPFEFSHDNNLDNLISVCRSCHFKAEWYFNKNFVVDRDKDAGNLLKDMYWNIPNNVGGIIK